MNKIFKFTLFSFIFLNKFNALDIKNIDISYYIKDNYFVSCSFYLYPNCSWIGAGIEKNILHNLYFNAGLNFNFSNKFSNNSFTSISLRYYFVTIKYKLFFNNINLNLKNLFICFTFDIKPVKITFDFFRASSFISKKSKYLNQLKKTSFNENNIENIVIKLKKEIYGKNFDINKKTTEDILNIFPENEYDNILKKYSLWLDLFKFINDKQIPNCSYDEVINLPQQINEKDRNIKFINFNNIGNTISINNNNRKNTIILNNIIFIDLDLIEEKILFIKLGLKCNTIIIHSKCNLFEQYTIKNNKLNQLKEFLSFNGIDRINNNVNIKILEGANYIYEFINN